MEWIRVLARIIIKDEYSQFIKDNTTLQSKLVTLEGENAGLYSTKSNLSNTIIEKQKEIENLNIKLNETHLTKIDNWCINNKILKVPKYYKDKIEIQNVRIDCDLRELITPNSLMVKRVRDSIPKQKYDYTFYELLMKKIHNCITWTREATDTYQLPCYSLKIKTGDCEDQAYAQASVDSNLGVAYGFLYDEKGNTVGGHAFCVGVIEDKLYIFDATENLAYEYNRDKKFRHYIHYIVTKNEVYSLDGSIEFGDVLWS